MSKVITYSRTFPAYHPKAGEPTYFVEKIWNHLENNSFGISYAKICAYNPTLSPDTLWPFWNSIVKGYINIATKGHTIRSGNRWKVGDKFSPRVWSGKPYNSKQIIIAPDIEIKKIWNIEIINNIIVLNGVQLIGVGQYEPYVELAKNDGLKINDFWDWFKLSPEFKKNKYFLGQILCWSENINY